jgi:hypothetical protein
MVGARCSAPIARSAEIDGQFRWTLQRVWGAGANIVWVGLNPSTADDLRDDPTMLREISFSQAWGFGSLTKVNIFPFRSASPRDLCRWLGERDDPEVSHAVARNHSVVKNVLRGSTIRIAAWGNNVQHADLKSFLANIMINKNKWEWHALGTNANGSPKHTLARGKHRIPNDQRPIIWRPRTS